MTAPLPPYFDGLIAARRAGQVGRHVHLGYWDEPPGLETQPQPGEFEHAQARLTERLIGLVPFQPGQAVLDVACGFGGTLAAIDAGGEGMRLTGLNIDFRQLRLCQDAVTAPGNVMHLVQADATALPFADARFDHVLCVEAMFHFASRRAFLGEAARVLRTGGVLAVTDILLRRPHPRAPWDHAMIETIVRRDYGPWPDPWVEVADLQRDAQAAGLQFAGGQNWSAATLPTYRTVAPVRDGGLNLRPAAGDMFRWLHANGWLTYVLLLFRR
jgi:MPBQ/MSBQ methyltransferase